MDLRQAQISIRLRDGSYLVDVCQEWIDRINGLREEEPSLAGSLYHPEEVAQIVELMQSVRHCKDEWQRLLATEILADALYQMVVDKRLPTRIPPIDAVEDFLHMGNPNWCANHPKRYGAFEDRDNRVCAHCLDGRQDEQAE